MSYYCECDGTNCSCGWEFKNDKNITDWDMAYNETDYGDDCYILHIDCPNLKGRKIVKTFGTAIVVESLGD